MKRIIILLGCLILVATLMPMSQAQAKQRLPFPPGGASPLNVTSHSGIVMADTMNVYIIFWEPTASKVSSSYNSLINRYFNDVGSSPLYHNNTQYGHANGTVPHTSRLVATWTDTRAYPGQTLAISDIQLEIMFARRGNNWWADTHSIFFVFTQQDEKFCSSSTNPAITCTNTSGSTLCAYHNYFADIQSPGNPIPTTVIYAMVPYAASFSGCKASSPLPNSDDADHSIPWVSHEQMEAATDPTSQGWYGLNQGDEIGDRCEQNEPDRLGTRNPNDGSNVVWNGHKYIVQQEWSNLLRRCTLGNDILYSLIINVNSQQVMGVGAASTANGATIVQWPDTFATPAPEHLWGFVDAGNGNIMIVNYNSGKVLGVPLAKNAQLLQWDNNGTSDHLWKIVPVNSPPGAFKILNVASGFVVGVAAASQGPGAPIVLWDDTNAPEHLWTLSAPSSYCPLC